MTLFMTSGNAVNAVLATLAPPPPLAMPSLFDALLGWVVALVLLLGPSTYLAWRSHSLLGHWTRYFAQSHRSPWWIALLGAIGLAFGAFTILGILPAWQHRWDTWYAASRIASPSDTTSLGWLSQTQTQYAGLLQLSAIVLCVVGLAALGIGMWRFQRTVLVRRTPVAPSQEWMMVPRGDS